MMSRIRIRVARLLTVGASAVALTVAASLPSFSQESVSLRLDWSALGYHAPFFYGVAKGYYKEQGLDLRVEDGRGSAAAATLVGNNNDDFGFADATTAARLINDGLPAQVVMGIFQRSTSSLFFRKGAMQTPKDLAGKRVSMCSGDGMSIYLPVYLKAIGLKPNDAQMVTVDCSVKYTAVAQDRADAVASLATAGKPLLRAVGIQDVASFDFADAGVVMPSHGIIASRQKIQSNPDMIRRFTTATAKSWDEARKNPGAAVDALIAARPLLKDKKALLEETLVDALVYLGGTKDKPFGWQSPDDWKKAEAILSEYAGMTRKTNEPFFTNQFR